ncbi:MAG: adenylate kinase [Candidatus Diapherotrites archaeon]
MKKQMNIILLGPPGTGKGTIAQFIEQKFGFKQISTGDLLREEVKHGTELGKKAEPIMKSGALVPDELLSEILEKNLNKNLAKGFVLDGYPRTLNQARLLEQMLARLNAKIGLILDVETSEEEIVRRLSARRQCPDCKKIYGLDLPPKKEGVCDACGGKLMQRPDDREEVVRKRLETYRKQTEPLIDYYMEKKEFTRIEGGKPLKEMFAEIESLLRKR